MEKIVVSLCDYFHNDYSFLKRKIEDSLQPKIVETISIFNNFFG